jgi:hypothetical protein
MTELRNRMDEAMVLRGFSPRTRESYLACVRALAKHYSQPPEGLDGPRIQAYLLHLITERKLAYATVNQASCAFRFLFGTVLRKPEMRLDIPMAKVPKRLPQILTRGEVSRLIEAAPTFRGRTAARAHLRGGASLIRGVCLATLRHRERPRAYVYQGAPRQGRSRSLYAALTAPAGDAAGATGAISGRALGSFPTVRAAHRSMSTQRSGSTAPRATPPASPQKAAFTACVTRSPLT